MSPPPLFNNFLDRFGRRDHLQTSKPIPAPEKQVKITDEDLLQIIDEVYLKSKEQLMKGHHNKVIEGLLFYCEYDICFRRILSSQLTNEQDVFGFENKVYLSEDIMSFIVIIQSYFNSFRVNLLSDIVKYLNDEYNRVLEMLPISFQQATVKFNNTNAINLFFINRLKDWHFSMDWDERDEVFENMFNETIAAFKELKLNATGALHRIINEQLRKL